MGTNGNNPEQKRTNRNNLV
ncbi:hypothetical protein BDFB_015131 [Asbolus verrucosus]|uniref:Uncharacterized protein n=1 Tax=Asbolus verrucosus TaxID=1661398 RepID=A0A482W6F0_ASBVE|nr:hypothetical protein BDFB_015131 [Asbolus verrucosus]